MSERQHIIQSIADVLQQVYGDATQTILDRQAAEQIWTHLTDKCSVVPISTVAAIVESAGGEIVLSDDALVDPPEELMIIPVGFTRVLRSRRRSTHAELP